MDNFQDHWKPEPPQSGWWWVFMGVLVLLILIGMTLFAFSRDLGQWEKMDPAQKLWFQQLMQPDTVGIGGPGISCCGEGDGYWADEVHVRDGKIYAVITDERDDGPLKRVHENPGTEYEIPPKKIVGMEQRVGNPTGHIVIFLGGPSWNMNSKLMQPRPVLCYVPNGGV